MTEPTVYNKFHKNASSNAVYIGRGSPFGNPFVIGKDGSREEAIEKFREYFMNNPDLQQLAKRKLVGKSLICFCAPKTCHGDVLLSFVNDG